ncbi:MAG: TonB-dependent receptor [Salinivirgaceae bacterium]|nr:TonB-dependent receptor [Salinivirgaceae bacterium]
MKRYELFLLLVVGYVLVCFQTTSAQNYTVSGYVKDQSSGEALIGANVYDSITLQGSITNSYGFYSLRLPGGQRTLAISFVGYQTVYAQINLTENRQYSAELLSGQVLDEVVVAANAREAIEGTQMSTHTIKLIDLRKMPALMGEVDIMKSIQKLPGIDGGTEASSGVFVRGGDPGQNLILLDGVPVYNVNHLFGFFSVFNNDAINNVDVVKGGFPARYGGRLSSVIDIRMKEGNMKDYDIEGSVGLLSSKLTISGPIIKDKTSFLVSGRRSYLDVLTRAAGKLTDEGVFGFWFGDLNLKVNHIISPRDRLYLSAYMGEDKFFLRGEWNDDFSKDKYEMALKWGNITSSMRWNHVFSGNLFSNTSLTYSRYRFGDEISLEYEDHFDNSYFKYMQEYTSGVEDITANVDFDYYPSTNHQIKFGVNYTYHTYNPGINVMKTDADDMEEVNNKRGDNPTYAHEMAAYVEDTWDISDMVKANVGARYSSFFVNEKRYASLEPRLSVRAKLHPDLALKGSVANMKQYIHLLSNSSITLPTDLWVPATENLKPQTSWQYALGANYLLQNSYKLSLEGYYKTMENVIAYKEGAAFTPTDQNWQSKVLNGRGWSYGAEFMGEKDWEKTNVAVAYTLSWTYRQFDELNRGEKFPYKYDRRHSINLSCTHVFSERFDVGLNWMYSTGSAFTVPYEVYETAPNPFVEHYYNDNTATHFTERNNYRAPAYHRLDVGVNFHKEKKWGERTWSLSLFNAYGRYNPVFMIVETDYDGGLSLKQYTLMRFVPSFSYSFKFK